MCCSDGHALHGRESMEDQAPDWDELAINPWKREEILVTVKAYPNPSKKYIETVCVAGVTKDRKWVRLYPIPYRYLEYEQQFPTYGRIKQTYANHPKTHARSRTILTSILFMCLASSVQEISGRNA